MKKIFAVLMLSMFLMATPGYAAKQADAPAEECTGLRIASGPAGKGFSKLFGDIKTVAGDSMSLCEVTSEGALDNLDKLATKKADLGFVMLDSLKLMSQSDDGLQELKVVAVLNNSYLHIVVNANGYNHEGPKKLGGYMKGDVVTEYITRFSQLRGKPVALVGSGKLMGRQLDKLMGYDMIFVDVDSDSTGFKMLQNNQVAAVFTVAGWPSGPISKLAQSDGLTLAVFDGQLPNGSAYGVKALNYKNIGVYNVQSMYVRNLLVTRPFTSASKINAVLALKKAIAANLPDLKDGEYEPGWNEIKSLDAPVDWPKLK